MLQHVCLDRGIDHGFLLRSPWIDLPGSLNLGEIVEDNTIRIYTHIRKISVLYVLTLLENLTVILLLNMYILGTPTSWGSEALCFLSKTEVWALLKLKVFFSESTDAFVISSIA